MGHREKNDTCHWCGKGTNKLQMRGGRRIGLCPGCCPDLDEEDIPEVDSLPPQWHFMDEKERERWLEGESAQEIITDQFYPEA